jgi:hypothetical protein
METLYELWESRFNEGIGEEISRDQRDEEKKKYMMLIEEKGGKFFVEEMRLSF